MQSEVQGQTRAPSTFSSSCHHFQFFGKVTGKVPMVWSSPDDGYIGTGCDSKDPISASFPVWSGLPENTKKEKLAEPLAASPREGFLLCQHLTCLVTQGPSPWLFSSLDQHCPKDDTVESRSRCKKACPPQGSLGGNYYSEQDFSASSILHTHTQSPCQLPMSQGAAL